MGTPDDTNGSITGFRFRRPISDMLLRWLVVLVPLALSAMAGLLGVEFQKYSDSIRNVSFGVSGHQSAVRGLTASMGAIGVVGLTAMTLWSGLIVTNANRVGHSLRTPWFAAVGWLLAPGLGFAAHLTLDKQLDSGALIGLTVFLAVLYLPFGTLGGAATDLGGNPHIARTWFLASVIGAFLLIVAMSGATSVLPVDNPQNVLKIRAFTCYLGSLMLLASSALAFATARNLNALIDHRWACEDDPDGVLNDPRRLKISRTGHKLRRRLTPTLFLRVIVAVGLLGTSLAWVGATFVLRGRALRVSSASGERERILADFRTASLAIATLSVAVHLAYVVWAIVAARNAHRRSLLAPNPLAVASSFLVGPIVIGAGLQLSGPFGAAVLTVGLILAVSGFVVGQFVLGRTVSALGGRGQLFLTWMMVDVALGVFAAFVSANSTSRIQIVAFGVVQAAIAMLGAAMAWTAMTRLDRVCRAYRHSGAITTGPESERSQPVPSGRSADSSGASGRSAGGSGGSPAASAQTTSLALTASQS